MNYLKRLKGWSTAPSASRKERLESDFQRVVLPLLDHMYRGAYYLTRDNSEAEDLVQETYLRAFTFFEQFEPGTNCRAWLASIMRNLFINRYRKKQREPEFVGWEKIDQAYETMIAEEERASGEDPERLFFSKLMGDEISKALQELPEEYRTAIVLVDVQELSYEETAKIMECPIGTVRSRVSRGRRLLQVALKDHALERGLIKETTQRDSARSSVQ